MDGVFLGLAGLLLGISLGLRPREISSEQPCQPSENPVHPSSFTWINPICIPNKEALHLRLGQRVDLFGMSSIEYIHDKNSPITIFFPNICDHKTPFK